MNAHFIAEVVDDFRYSILNNFNTTFQTRAPREAKNYHRFNMDVENTHVLQYKTAPFPTLSRPASRSAFSSAWMHRHSSKPSMADAPPSLHRLQPPSVQLGTPRGVPLYLQIKVETKVVSLTKPRSTTYCTQSR